MQITRTMSLISTARVRKALDKPGMPSSLNYSPVPGGVGTVTTALLLRNIVKVQQVQKMVQILQ